MTCSARIITSGAGIYEHGLVVLAEGLRRLGWSVTGPRNYWRRSLDGDDWLIPRVDDIDASDVDLLIVGSGSLVRSGARWVLPDLVREEVTRAPLSVFLDESDGSIAVHGAEPPAFDVVLKCHSVRRYRYHPNVRPWAFGLSERMIEALAWPPDEPRRHILLDNARNAHPVRDLALRVRPR